MPLLFSYGTLQQDDVQCATFGRLLHGHGDELPGYEPSLVEIADPRHAAAVGRTHHANVIFNGFAASRVPGVSKTCVRVGEVSREVARAAREHDADLIVIGRGGAPEMWGRLGSHAYAIVRRAPCPVLCI